MTDIDVIHQSTNVNVSNSDSNVHIDNNNKDVSIIKDNSEFLLEQQVVDVSIINDSTNVAIVNDAPNIQVLDTQVNIEIVGNGIPFTTISDGINTLTNISTITFYGAKVRGANGKGEVIISGGGDGGSGTISYIDTDSPLTWDILNSKLSLNYSNDFDIVDGQLSLYKTPILDLQGEQILEVGDTLNGLWLTWTLNKTVESRLLTSSSTLIADLSSGASGSYFINDNLTSNQTYTLEAIDSKGTTIADSITIKFTSKRYWGLSSKLNIDDTDILSFNSELAFNPNKTWQQDGQGLYIYYCYPASWGLATFTVNGLLNTAWTLVTQTHINQFGISVLYNVYRTNVIQFGNLISINVK